MLALALSIAATAVAGSAATEGPASGVCPKMIVGGVVGGTVSAGVTIAEGSSTAVKRATCDDVAAIVRELVERRAEMPQRVDDYRCTPTVTGRKIAWECVYRGGKPRTTVTVDFAYRLKRG